MRIALIESLWRVGLLPINAVRPFAIEALADGFSGPALFELADGGYGTWREVEETFGRALIEMGRAPLTEEEASMQAAWCICEDIASGAVEPYRGIERIRRLRLFDGIDGVFGSVVYFDVWHWMDAVALRDSAEGIRQAARDLVMRRDTVGG